MPTILITGSNRGLGLEFVKQYAKDEWDVIACCRTPDKADELQTLAKNHEGKVSVHKLDVSDFKAIEEFGTKFKGRPIDVLINNAGVYERLKNQFGQIDYDNWIESFQINTLAPIKMAEIFIENVAKSEKKTIISISSKVGSIADNTSGKRYIYRSTKTALNMAVKSLSIDLKPQGIIAVSLHPGWVLTDMGGPNALIDTKKSIQGMKQVIQNLTMTDSGKFLNYDGTEIPW